MKIIVFLFVFISVVFAETMSIPTDATCLIRNFKVYQAPAWASTIKVRSGQIIYFSSPKSMFEFYYNIQRWEAFDAKELADFKNILVTDYNTLKIIDARKSFFVYGSHNISPAGDDLVAFDSKEEAQKFLEKNNGKRILSFTEVKNSLIRLLNGRI